MRAALCIIALAGSLGTYSEPNIDPAHSVINSDSIGALNWAADPDYGASINQYYCSGFIYGANVGWIKLSTGVPADKFHFKNNSADDFGVNVLPGGALRGFAWGANIGWINFEELGNPRVDWSTGKILGAIWSANTGWIQLDGPDQSLRIAFLPEQLDSDGDGLPDAWEIQTTGNLTSLSGDEDTDGDGQTDLDEYLAGTNPLDPQDFLGPVKFSVSVHSAAGILSWPSKAGYTYRVEARASFGGSTSWTALPGSTVTGTGSTLAFQLPADGEHLFIRVRAWPPLSAPAGQ
jgi:hypothetical protein